MDELPPEEGLPEHRLPGEGVHTDVAPSVTKPNLAARYGTMGVALALLVAGVSVAVLRGTTESPDLATVTPSDAVVFVQVALKPEGDVRDGLRDLLSRMPEASQRALVSQFEIALDKAFARGGLSYRDDVKPWVGAHMGFAVRLPSGGDIRRPSVVALMQVTDAGAARAAIQKASANAGTTPAYEIQDGILYVSDRPQVLASFTSSGAKLSSNANFQRLQSKVGDGLVFAYFDTEEVTSLLQNLGAAGGVPFALPGGTTASQGAIAIKAESDGIAMVGHSIGTPQAAVKTGTPKLAESSSSGLLGEFTFFDPAAIFEQFFKIAQGLPPEGIPGPALKRAQLEEQLDKLLGLDLDKDVLSWLHGEVSVVVGGITLPVPDIGVLIEPTDQDAVIRTMKALQSHAKEIGKLTHSVITPAGSGFNVEVPNQPATIVVRRGLDRVVIASNDDYAAKLLKASADSLGNDSVYQHVLGGTGQNVSTQVYVRLDRVRQVVETFLDPSERAEYEKNVAPFVRNFQALAIRVTQDGAEGDFVFRLTLTPK